MTTNRTLRKPYCWLFTVGVLCALLLMTILWIPPSDRLAHAQTGPLGDIPTIESEHPYANNFDHFWTIDQPGAEATRIHFSRIELKKNADYLIISDPSEQRTQVITGVYTDGLWIDPVPGEYIRIRLVTDRNVRKWGFAIDQKEAVDYPSIIRSVHPYYNNTDETWTVLSNDANPEATRIHFSQIELEEDVDFLILSGIDGNPYQYITGSHPDGLWSMGIPGIAVQVQLVTDGSGEEWGFNVDAVESTTADSPESPPSFTTTLVESDHPYEDNITQEWTLINPNPDAVSTKVHFDRIDLHGGDYVQLLDTNDAVVQTFGQYTHATDVWSDYVPGRIVKVKFTAQQRRGKWETDWGVRIDATANAVLLPGLVQSNHSYGDDTTQEGVLTNPNPDAVSTKVHFDRIDLHGGDYIELLDANDTVVQTFGQYTHETDVWSDYVPGRIVKVKFTAQQRRGKWETDWGFRIDDMHPTSTDSITPASITGVYVTVVHPGAIYLNDTQVAYAQEPGEYKVLLLGLGDYIIHIEYTGYTGDEKDDFVTEYTQDILVSLEKQEAEVSLRVTRQPPVETVPITK